MANLASIRCGFYRIPLPVVLSDSTHGEMHAFELNTVRLTDAEGAEGVGYTYTAGRNGAAVYAILEREIAELFAGEEADEIERIWRKAWWALHYGGRGGPTVLALSAFDMALWDLKAKRARLPLWNLLGGFDARVPCYAGGIDLDLALDKLLRQTEDNLAKGFRAIKMKVGRKRLAEDIERVKAMRAHLGEGFPLMVDANMKWSVDEAIRDGGVQTVFRSLAVLVERRRGFCSAGILARDNGAKFNVSGSSGSSCAGSTRASVFFANELGKKLDRRVGLGDDDHSICL